MRDEECVDMKVKVFMSRVRDGMESENFKYLCSDKCASHGDDLWEVLKESYTVLIGGGKTVEDLYKLITSSNVTNLGALNTTHPPANSFIEQLRRGSLFLKTNQESWSKRPGDYALRRHNARHEGDRSKQIIIQDIVRDWVEYKYDLPIERAAAVTHLQTTMMLPTILSEWWRVLEMHQAIWPMRDTLHKNLDQLPRALDIPEDMWEHGGFHIMLADNGAYQAMADRNDAMSLFRTYLTTTSETQVGQGSASTSTHIQRWDQPLMPRDDRAPAATEHPPFWDKNPIEMRNIPEIDLTGPSASSFAAPKAKAMPKRPTSKPMPSSRGHPGSTGTPPGTPRPKARPTPSGGTPSWVILALPTGVSETTLIEEDYGESKVMTRHWRDLGNTVFVLSVMQGPAAAASHITAQSQYLRRVTTYACMCFGIMSATLVTNEAACRIPDDEWLRM